MSKIWAITGGGDWADASVDFVTFDGELGGEMGKMIEGWRAYCEERYAVMKEESAAGRSWFDKKDSKVPKYIPLHKWLLDAGGRLPTNDELEVIDDEP